MLVLGLEAKANSVALALPTWPWPSRFHLGQKVKAINLGQLAWSRPTELQITFNYYISLQ